MEKGVFIHIIVHVFFEDACLSSKVVFPLQFSVLLLNWFENFITLYYYYYYMYVFVFYG